MTEQKILEIMQENKKYKSLEEELGIDLITLFKALKNGIYLNKDYEEPIPVYLDKDLYGKKFCLCSGHKAPTNYHFKDYGKIWALTEEELL